MRIASPLLEILEGSTWEGILPAFEVFGEVPRFGSRPGTPGAPRLVAGEPTRLTDDSGGA